MDQKLFDQQVQRQLDIVNKILAATIQDRETAREAAAAVNTLSARVDARLTSLAAEVRGSAEETATQAAHLLEKHFTAANIAAEDARLCFERARQALGWKVFAILVAAFL
ncbi:MAG: hypothetical protein FWD67_08495, partial [Betaproteobacteria bacterium]|nr:hypothetical protein [Betaproteobacteria bacterium]